jgi:hypothetical protein
MLCSSLGLLILLLIGCSAPDEASQVANEPTSTLEESIPPTTEAISPTPEENNVNLEIPNLPEGEQPPSFEEMADLLVQGLPEADRAEARTILIEQILPDSLTGLATHPRPRRLAEVVYGYLLEDLQAVDPAERIAVVRATAYSAEIGEQAIMALALATARYFKEHPEVAAEANGWSNATVEAWQAREISEIVDEAAARLEQLAKWEEEVKENYPHIWESYRVDFLNTQLTLQSARTGSYETAAGSLYDFLTTVGAPVTLMDIQ